MALDIKMLNLLCDLHKKNFFSEIESVIDMGDQDLNLNYDELNNNLGYMELEKFYDILNHAKSFPARPRLSTSVLWKIFGLKVSDRLDIIQLERSEKDPIDNFFKVDLNFPINEQVKIGQYDLVTDFGNNEHPFNITESYKTMHNLCKKNGFLLINQCVFGGNGFYNFDITFFENVAAVNNYTSIYSSLVFISKEKYFFTPIDNSYFKMIDMKNIDSVDLIHIYKKNNNENFYFPYQGSGKSLKNEQYFNHKFHFVNLFPSRTYLPKSYNDLSLTTFIKYLFNKSLRKK